MMSNIALNIHKEENKYPNSICSKELDEVLVWTCALAECVNDTCIHHGHTLWDVDWLIKLSIIKSALQLPSHPAYVMLSVHQATHRSNTLSSSADLGKQPWYLTYNGTTLLHLQVYDVKQGGNLVEKTRLFIRKVTGPLHPKVDDSQAQNIKSLSHPFSREKQHLWVKRSSFLLSAFDGHSRWLGPAIYSTISCYFTTCDDQSSTRVMRDTHLHLLHRNNQH